MREVAIGPTAVRFRSLVVGLLREGTDRAVVHPHREDDDQRAPRLDQALARLLVEVEHVSAAKELRRRDPVQLRVPFLAYPDELAIGDLDLIRLITNGCRCDT